MTDWNSAETMRAIRAEVAAAFDEWLRRYEEDPEIFGDIDADGYGDACAGYLIELLAEGA